MWFKYYTLLKKEVLQFVRNVPLLVIVLYACTLDVYMAAGISSDLKNYPIAIYDMDRSEKSRELVRRIRPPYFIVHSHIDSAREIDDLILRGEVGMVLMIPRNFHNRLSMQKSAPVQLVMDATSSNTAELASNYLSAIVNDFSYDVLIRQWHLSNKEFLQIPYLTCEKRFAFNANLTDEWAQCINEFFTIFTLIAILLPATAMVNEKQFGTIEQLMVTPVRPFEVMLAKVIPMIGVFLLASLIAIYVVIIPVGVPVRGSILDFLILNATFCFASAGIGLLVSTVSNNLSETVLLTLLILFPILFLSGTWVPPEAMPPWMRGMVVLSPLKYYMTMGYGIFLKGNSLLFMWKDFVSLLGLGIAIFWIGAIRFKKMFG